MIIKNNNDNNNNNKVPVFRFFQGPTRVPGPGFPVCSLTVTALKSLLLKGNAKTKLYRDYNSFNIDHFKEDLDNNLKNNSITEYSHFQNIFLEILHKHAPIKKKILRFNDNPFMTKALRKAIMHRSKLKNIFHKTRAKEDWNNYKKQRNFCVNLLRNTKKDYFQKLNIKDLTDNKNYRIN